MFGVLCFFTLGASAFALLARFYSESVRFCDDVPPPYKPIYCGTTLSAGRDDNTGEVIVATSWRSTAEHRFGAVETWLDPNGPRSLPYIQEMVHLALAHGGRHVLVLGLGGGAVPFLLNRFCSDCKVTAVDITPEALLIVRQFIHADDGVNTVYIEDDAVNFLGSAARESFDVVLDDIYIGHERPKMMESLQFMHLVQRVLSPGGQYVINLCTPMTEKRNLTGYLERLRQNFHTTSNVFIPDTQNIIVIASKA